MTGLQKLLTPVRLSLVPTPILLGEVMAVFTFSIVIFFLFFMVFYLPNASLNMTPLLILNLI